MITKLLSMQLRDYIQLAMFRPPFCQWACSYRAQFTKQFFRPISSKRWQARQGKDVYTKEAESRGLKSRAAFKLLQINDKYKIFKVGQTVVDLGYAPGSWSQVAATLTQPRGRVVGVDLIPALPPKGVSTIQGNFLSPRVQAYVTEFLRDPNRGRPRSQFPEPQRSETEIDSTPRPIEERDEQGYIDFERTSDAHNVEEESRHEGSSKEAEDRSVDVVLSDMLMNTSGSRFRDHAGSVELCEAALEFASKVLKPGGYFICKFYQGREEKSFENQLKELFHKVHREKPDSSRDESREVYFVGLRRRNDQPK